MNKKLFLTLVGVVGVTGISWGQTHTNSVYFTGYNDFVFDGTTVNPNGEYVYAGTTYESPDGSYSRRSWVNVSNSNLVIESINLGGWWFGTRLATLPSSSDVIYVHQSIEDFLSNSQPWLVAPGVSSSSGGTYVPGGNMTFTNPNPSSSVFVEQAQELNVGLEFIGGQWNVKE